MSVAPIALMGLVVLAVSMVPAQGCAGQERDPASQEEQEFLEILRNARPAPQPSGRALPEGESGSLESRTLVGYDLLTGREVVTPPSVGGETRSGSAPSKQPQLPRSQEEVLTAPEGGSAIEELDPDSPVTDQTPPTGNLVAHSLDAKITYKLLLRFNVSGSDHFYICEASSLDGLELSTFGHCIYKHDPDGDGNTSDAGWAQEVWAWESQAGLESPQLGPSGTPLEASQAVLLRSYRGWVDSGDPGHDVGYVTLDRRPEG